MLVLEGSRTAASTQTHNLVRKTAKCEMSGMQLNSAGNQIFCSTCSCLSRLSLLNSFICIPLILYALYTVEEVLWNLH